MSRVARPTPHTPSYNSPGAQRVTDGPRRITRVAAAFAFLGLLALVLVLPHGENAPRGHMEIDPSTGERRFVHDGGSGGVLRTLGAITGQLSAMVLVVSLALGRHWPLVRRLGAARRVRLHARLGKVVLALAALHTGLLVINLDVRGWLPGALALVAFALHGATHAWRARLIYKWGAGWWEYVHRASAWAALLLSIEHVIMASWHWGLARWFEHSGWGH